MSVSVYLLELRRVLRCAAYIASVTALALCAYFRGVFPPTELLPAEAGQGLAYAVDGLSGAHARQFCSRIGDVLALSGALSAAALFDRDRGGRCEAVYARALPSWALCLCRFAALASAMLLPVLAMSATLTCVAAGDYGIGNIDLAAYLRYALLWSLPSILLSVGVGALPSALTGLPLGPALVALWLGAGPSGDSYASLLAPAHDALGDAAALVEGMPTLALSRIVAALLGLSLMALTALMVERRRRGMYRVRLCGYRLL